MSQGFISDSVVSGPHHAAYLRNAWSIWAPRRRPGRQQHATARRSPATGTPRARRRQPWGEEGRGHRWRRQRQPVLWTAQAGCATRAPPRGLPPAGGRPRPPGPGGGAAGAHVGQQEELARGLGVPAPGSDVVAADSPEHELRGVGGAAERGRDSAEQPGEVPHAGDDEAEELPRAHALADAAHMLRRWVAAAVRPGLLGLGHGCRLGLGDGDGDGVGRGRGFWLIDGDGAVRGSGFWLGDIGEVGRLVGGGKGW